MLLRVLYLIALSAPSSHDWTDKVNILSTAVMALFTTALWVLAYYQLKAYRNKERAWMMIDIAHKGGIQLPPIVYPSTGLTRFRLDMRNLGETPATIIYAQHDGRLLRREEKLPKRPPYLDKPLPEPINEIIAPTGGTPVYSEFNQDAMRDIGAGLTILYLFGRVIYKDIFGKERETRYCLRYYPQVTNSTDPHVGLFSEGPSEYQRMT